MSSPKVTFFVPCYKLAHLLTACVESILAQTYGDFEVLIMDDCSPDNTPEVARSFTDPRVRHIRNEPNLGHLRNYNKAIALAAGEYVWLISADDRLRSPVVLERYLEVMEAHPRVGFAFCPGVGLQGEQETGIVKYGWLPGPDAVLDGRAFLHRLLESNCVLAPAGLVRKECYERVGVFPLDLPFAGDWYLWCAFALHYDVAYFAEPMVNYREHTESMTGQFIAEALERRAGGALAHEGDDRPGWRRHRSRSPLHAHDHQRIQPRPGLQEMAGRQVQAESAGVRPLARDARGRSRRARGHPGTGPGASRQTPPLGT
jgi:glycosyltransferase involved in cell wall biosynthesis